MKITFLGTSDAVPTATRNHTAVLLENNGENILVDCGEGTQRQFRKAGINPGKVTKILITHWHGDHVLGLPGLIQTLSMNGYNQQLEIYGPQGSENYMKRMLGLFIFSGKYLIDAKDIDEGKFLTEKDYYIEAKPMTHGVPCNAYVFVKKGQIRIDKKKLKKTGLPSNSILQKLKEGKDISYNGKKYKAKDLTFKEEEKKIAFVYDTSMNKNIIPFVKNADALICESTFGEDMEQRAGEYNHLTSKQAAQIAKEAKVGKLYLTHISQRYEKNKKKILAEAKKIFKNSFLAEDLMSFEI